MGFTNSGKRRFLCLVCRRTFGKPKRIKGTFTDFVTFYDFVKNKRNKAALCEELFVSRKSLWRTFKPFFNYLPTSRDSLFLLHHNDEKDRGMIDPHSRWVLGLDGKWLHRAGVVMIYRNVTDRVNLFWAWHPSESYEAIAADFTRLMPIIKENLPRAVVSDWKGAIVAGVTSHLPPIPHQRCLTHVQRQLLTLLPLRSPIQATRKLRIIAKQITAIYSPQEKDEWIAAVHDWILTYEDLLRERTVGVGTKKKWWYTHGNLRRAVKLLLFDEDHLFAYLIDPIIPSTNNSLEGVNSQIKGKLSNHRGMKTPQKVTFIFWLLTFSRVKTRRELKELWDRLKNKMFRF